MVKSAHCFKQEAKTSERTSEVVKSFTVVVAPSITSTIIIGRVLTIAHADMPRLDFSQINLTN